MIRRTALLALLCFILGYSAPASAEFCNGTNDPDDLAMCAAEKLAEKHSTDGKTGELKFDGAMFHFCEAEWKDDYAMQLYCRRKQVEGYEFLVLQFIKDSRDGIPANIRTKVFVNCLAEWKTPTNYVDYAMALYCYRKQTAAFNALQN